MIKYSSSFRDFLYRSDSRIAKILTRIDNLSYYDSQKYKDLITISQVNYLTFRSDGTISFLPAGKEHKVNDDGSWAREGRQNGRPGKVIRKLFKDKLAKLIPDKEFEIFSNKYKAEYNGDDHEFTLLPSKKISAVYGMEREPGGRLGDSCMNDDTDYFDIYKNCKQLQILIMKNKEGKLCGRALVWKVSDDFTLMDRIYTCKDFLDEMFISYAIKQGWHYKKHYATFDYKDEFITPLGKEIQKDLKIITPTEFDKYPYIDTFSYGGDGYLNNHGDGPYEYDCTDGDRSGGRDDDDEDDHYGEIYDDIADEYISESSAIQIERGCRRGQWTHESCTVQVNGLTYWEDDDLIIRIDDEWHLKSECVWSELDQEDYLKKDCVYSDSENSWILENDAAEIDGKWYHEDDACWSSRDCDTYLKEDCVKTDGGWIKKEEAIQIEDNWYHKEDTVFSHYHNKDLVKDDCEFCDDLESWVLRADAVQIENKWYHKSSYKTAKLLLNRKLVRI